MDVASFNIFPTDSKSEAFFKFDQMDEEPYNDFFMAMGYSSSNSIINLGQLFTIVMIIFLLVVFAFMLKLLNLKKGTKLQRLVNYTHTKILYNVPLR